MIIGCLSKCTKKDTEGTFPTVSFYYSHSIVAGGFELMS